MLMFITIHFTDEVKYDRSFKPGDGLVDIYLQILTDGL